MKRPIHIFIIESEASHSVTSVRSMLNEVKIFLRSTGSLGKVEFHDGASVADLQNEAAVFAAWTKQLPEDDPVVLWISVHGANSELGVHEDKRKFVGTSGVSAQGEEVQWLNFFAPVKAAVFPQRVVVLMDVCCGASPTAPSRLSTPKEKRPAMLFGPARPAKRSELDAASRSLFRHLENHGIPSLANTMPIVDDLNASFPPALASGTPFYRMWWWNGDILNRYPSPPQVAGSQIKRK